jgi:hypothetical protein
MRKIGIVTFHRSVNYGAVLQSYALKYMINTLGAQCNIIDYKNPYIEEINKVKFLDFNSIKSLINGILTYHSRKAKFGKFVDFRKEYLMPVKFKNDLDYDAFITGSDQVWNYKLSQFDTTYFLDFVKDNNKKNSYAASFGISEIPNEHTEKYKNLLIDFNKISVREEQGLQIINTLLKREAPVVLDPTLLLDMGEWKNTFRINNNSEKKYILLYLMIPDPNLIEFAEYLSKETGYEVIYITDKVKKSINATYARTVSPIEWLELFMDATYIVTNSFHGVAFSINFNKNFFMSLLPSTANVNSRLENIINLFGLENRKIVKGQKENIFENIDYSRVNYILEQERVNSINYLKDIIS